jgi:DNA polymerase I-like protein with 3'-5' exonuclease and polymerase domains
MEAAKRQSRNFMIQGYCSSITFKSLLDIIRKLREKGLKSRVISTVHDSILMEYKLEELKDVLKITKDATWITMPAFNGHTLKSDCALSEKSWGDKEEVDWETGLPKEK